MGFGGVLVATAVIGLAAVGCGSGANGARKSTRSARSTVSGRTTASATTRTAVAGAGTTGLRRFLLGNGDEPGYSDQGTADVSSSLGYWLSTYPTDNGEVNHGAVSSQAQLQQPTDRSSIAPTDGSRERPSK